MPVGRKPGTPKTGGRKKGTPNKATRDIRKAVLEAFEKGGGPEWLRKQMEENPVAFMNLLGKILPTQITGAGDGALEIQVVRKVIDVTPTRVDDSNAPEITTHH